MWLNKRKLSIILLRVSVWSLNLKATFVYRITRASHNMRSAVFLIISVCMSTELYNAQHRISDHSGFFVIASFCVLFDRSFQSSLCKTKLHSSRAKSKVMLRNWRVSKYMVTVWEDYADFASHLTNYTHHGLLTEFQVVNERRLNCN